MEDDDQDGGSSPFVSTELYNKIMEGGNAEDTPLHLFLMKNSKKY